MRLSEAGKEIKQQSLICFANLHANESWLESLQVVRKHEHARGLNSMHSFKSEWEIPNTRSQSDHYRDLNHSLLFLDKHHQTEHLSLTLSLIDSVKNNIGPIS